MGGVREKEKERLKYDNHEEMVMTNSGNASVKTKGGHFEEHV